MTSVWAPKPTAAPMTVAVATNGTRLMSSTPRMARIATTQMMIRNTEANTPVKVRARSSPRGVLRTTGDTRRRDFTMRRASPATTLLNSNARPRISRILRGPDRYTWTV